MPTGKVKWFDQEKGFGFVTNGDEDQVFLHASALPDGMQTIAPGTEIEYSIASSKRGTRALSVRVLAAIPSLAKAKRKPCADMIPIVEDLIYLLDKASDSLRRGKYPENARSIAKAMRALATDFDA